VSIIVVLTALAFVFTFLAAETRAAGSAQNVSSNLTIFDTALPSDPIGSIKLTHYNVTFYANLTNSTGVAINASTTFNGICNISFNYTGFFDNVSNMTFNVSSGVWEFNRSFDFKGTHTFLVECSSNEGNVSVNDTFQISNTLPDIDQNLDGTVNTDGDEGTQDVLACTEDTFCTYNFSSNVTEVDVNDNLTYSVGDNTTLTNYTLNETSGLLEINVTIDGDSGSTQIELGVKDTESATQAAILKVNVSALNDAPIWVDLTNQSFNYSDLFLYQINATDEENNTPFNFSITFQSCTVEVWSNRNCSNSSGPILFNDSQYTYDTNKSWLMINFTPTFNDVGDYVINFTVTDLNNNVTPFNASTTRTINFTVNNINNAPSFLWACDNSRQTHEGNQTFCYINASDLDETTNITYTANYTWFTFNDTSSNYSIGDNNITTEYNSSVLVNFTGTDSEVGNWSINITIEDNGLPQGINSTTFYFYIGNTNDSVSTNSLDHVVAFTSNNYTLFVNATDDDLLIPDESVYNETLNFTTNNTNIEISGSEISGTNISQATITFNPNDLGNGNHTINVTVRDRNYFSLDSFILSINVSTNNAPEWNASFTGNYSLNEDTAFSLNLSANVSDSPGEDINFTYYNETSFPSFSLNAVTGVISFTPNDTDVGHQIVHINATDGIQETPYTFNFTVYNINDTPVIQAFPASPSYNISNSSINVNATEDNVTRITIWVHDFDLTIPSNQESFYDENLTINLTIEGPNPLLFNFTAGSSFPNVPERLEWDADFTPNKTDVGVYNVTINVSDQSNLSELLVFNLSVIEISHAPTITDQEDVNSSIIGTLYLDFNATDVEDINESYSGGNMSFSMVNLSSNGSFIVINYSTGVINFTFNQTFAGRYSFNVTVNDSSGQSSSDIFNLTVYDYPVFLLPDPNFFYHLIENTSTQINFTVNHTIGDKLNYTLRINGKFRNSTLDTGNGTAFYWNVSSNFTDETTCLTFANITLNASNGILSNETTWNLTINHTSAPLLFSNTIADQSGGSPILITLSDFFTDIDASDPCLNQTVGFTIATLNASGGIITVVIKNWTNSTNPTANFSATTAGTANYTLTAFEYNDSFYNLITGNASSNNFTVQVSVTSTTTPSPSSGGGGGSSAEKQKIISLKIIVPEPVSAKKKDKIIVPVGIWNDGELDLNEIILDAVIAKNGILRTDLIASFDKSFIPFLGAGQRENVTMIVDIDTSETGLFEVTINGTVKDPEYSDWGKFFIEIQEEEDVLEKIVFTEEFIVGNPECAELFELIQEAKNLFIGNNPTLALSKADEALEACKRAISQPARLRRPDDLGQRLLTYTSIASIIAFVLGFAYYYYKRIKLKRSLVGFENFQTQPTKV
jgi:hypothetical protein